MKLKLSLKNSAKYAPLFSFILSLILCGCQSKIEPTYKENQIPYLVKKICKDEYSLDVTTKRTQTTLWIYAPLSKMLHKDYGMKKDKIFDEEMLGKLRNILTTVGRVLISSDNTPEFFALLASDINIGLNYTIIGNVLDIKKSYAGFIPETEANRRYVIGFKLAPEAVGDKTGEHLEVYDVKLPDFLSEQMAQRIAAKFQSEDWKKYFKVDKSEGKYHNGAFIFEYSISRILRPPEEINIRDEILKIITYCIKTYDFKDFSEVEISDLEANDKVTLNAAAVWARPTE